MGAARGSRGGLTMSTVSGTINVVQEGTYTSDTFSCNFFVTNASTQQYYYNDELEGRSTIEGINIGQDVDVINHGTATGSVDIGGAFTDDNTPFFLNDGLVDVTGLITASYTETDTGTLEVPAGGTLELNGINHLSPNSSTAATNNPTGRWLK
jgi:hypothetical protein